MAEHTVLQKASWRDDRTGVEEQAVFLEVDGAALMAIVHLPAAPPVGGVVVCSPIDREQVRHYHREVILARGLAAGGVAAVRFQYRGTGNSDPLEAEPLSLDTMEHDIAGVASWFLETVGVDRLGFLAGSLAAPAAARVAMAYPGAPLALLEPVVRPATFYRHLHRTRLIAEARDGGSEWPLRRSLSETLDVDGWADVLGYRLDADAYRRAVARDLITDLGPQPRPVLTVQVDKKAELRPELTRLVAQWQERGFDAEALTVQTQHAWWFIPEWEPEVAEDENTDLVPGVVRWLVSRLRGRNEGASWPT